MVLGCVKLFADSQGLDEQKRLICEYIKPHGLSIDGFVEIGHSAKTTMEQIESDTLGSTLLGNDIVVALELSQLGRSTSDVLSTIRGLVEERGIRLHIIKQNFILDRNSEEGSFSHEMISMFGLFTELEKELISTRTREALRERAKNGVKLGKPKGTIQISMFDKDKRRIRELIDMGVPIKTIVDKHLKYGTRQSLALYIERVINKQQNSKKQKAIAT